jgi:hypothetical protein
MEWELTGETKILGENLPQYRFAHQNSHMIWPGLETGQPQWKPVTNCLSYGTTSDWKVCRREWW